MKIIVTCAAILFAWVPALAWALTIDELVEVLEEKDAQTVERINPEYYPRMLSTLTPVFELGETEDRYWAIVSGLDVFYFLTEQSVLNMIEDFRFAGVLIDVSGINEIREFISVENEKFARQILATNSSIEQIDAVTARLREENVAKRMRLQALNERLAELRGQEAELRGQEAELRGQGAEQGGRLAELRRQEAELRGQEAELRGQEAELRGQEAELLLERERLLQLIASADEIISALEASR